jgi:hypothetical protein
MRAKTINEQLSKFTEDSDPIRDMGIGGVKLNDVHAEIQDRAANEWIKLLNDSLVGKTITGRLSPWKGRRGSWDNMTIKVKKIVNTKERNGFESSVSVVNEDGNYYNILGDEKLTIKDAS